MRYQTDRDFLAALGERLKKRSQDSGVSLDRLRRRVLVERVLARIVVAEPGQWVLKGGMALEVRLGNQARLTKDIDLGLRELVSEAADLHQRISSALATEPDHDCFKMTAGRPVELMPDGAGHLTWRIKIDAGVAGKPFGRLQLDVSPRPHELDATEFRTLEGQLTFAGVPAPTVEIIDVNRHAAEKFHAMLRTYGSLENTRVRDLVDVVTLHEHGLIEPLALADAVRQVWRERDGADPPATFPALPPTWLDRYPQLLADHPLGAANFADAAELAANLWYQMFPTQET